MHGQEDLEVVLRAAERRIAELAAERDELAKRLEQNNGLGADIGPKKVVGHIPVSPEPEEGEEETDEREATLRGILKAAPIGIGVVQLPDRKIKWANQFLCDLLGYSPEEVEDQNSRIFYPSEEEYHRSGDIMFTQVKKFGVGSVETALKAKDGRVYNMKLRSALGGRDRNMVVFTAIDITERKLTEEALRNSLAEKDLLLREVHHRVKNNLQIVSSLMDMSRRRAKDEVASGTIRDMQSRIMAMSLIHNMLYDREQFDWIDIGAFTRDLFRNLSTMYDPSGELLEAEFEMGTVNLPLDKAVPCGLVLNEALTNVFKHATHLGRKTKLRVEASSKNGEVEVCVRDDGPGYGPGFDADTMDTLGIKLIRNLIEIQLKGEVRFSNDNGMSLSIHFKADSNDE